MCSPPRVAWCRSPEPISLSGMHAARIRKWIWSEYHGRALPRLPLVHRPSAQEQGCTAGRGLRRIFVAVIDGSAAGRVDQMHTAARKTSQGLIALLLRLVRLVGEPALHTQAGLWAAVKECSHCIVWKAAETGTAQVPRSCIGS